MKKSARTKFTTRAWTGLWSDGVPGWRFSPYIHARYPASVIDVAEKGVFTFAPLVGTSFYRVRVTVELVKDKRGRFITRKTKGASRA